MKIKKIFLLIILVSVQYLTACSLSISNFSENINKAIKANNDPQTVMQALPAYIVLLDGLIENNPQDETVLIASSRLMNAYASLLGSENEMLPENDVYLYQKNKLKRQQAKLNKKALQRAADANCIHEEYLCDLTTIKYTDFENRLEKIDEDDIAMLYSLGSAWVMWLQINSSDWNAMAQLPKIKLLMEKLILIDENWQNAGAHMYLGVLNSLLPATLGGKPEQGKMHFEAAIRLSKGENMMAKVLYAQYYARLIFSESLHQQLISDVLKSEGHSREFTLLNVLAKQKAEALKISAQEFF